MFNEMNGISQNLKYTKFIEKKMRMKNNKPHLNPLWVTLAIVIIIVAIMIFEELTTKSNDYQKHDYQLLQDKEGSSYRQYSVDVDPDERLIISFTLENGSKVDVYLLTHEEMFKYWENKDFNATKSWQNTSGFQYSKMYNEDFNGVIMVDNWDNPKPDDAISNGNVTFTLKYRVDHRWKTIKGDFIVMIPIITVVIIAIGFYHYRKEK